jgi:hypothetical protein
MSARVKIRANDPCPCGSGRKFKRCCSGSVDWSEIIRTGQDQRRFLSIRGRNLLFIEAIFGALGLDNEIGSASLSAYKKSFTAEAVRKIYESVVELWPIDTNIESLLGRVGADVSGVYIGDYDPPYISRAIVRHSIYANKILLIDPFQHPYILRDEYNPLVNPSQYRAQTLKSVNFYLAMWPWIDAGIVEFIRTPGDFDRKLNFGSVRRTKELYDSNPELQAAAKVSARDMHARHHKEHALHMMLLGAPDSVIRRTFRQLNLGSQGFTENDFIEYVNTLRERDPDFLEPMGTGENKAQLHMLFSGGTFEMARLSAQMAGSYLFTDLRARWALIEHDRKQHSAENKVWSPFAKAVQNIKLNYLNNLSLEHALRLRNEHRLEGVRSLLTRAWEKVRGDEPFDEQGAIHLANELTEAVDEAEAEWNQIQKDLVRFVGGGIAAGALSAGPVIAAGHALWLAAAGAVGTAGTAAWSSLQRRAYLKKHPAAFFMDLRAD